MADSNVLTASSFEASLRRLLAGSGQAKANTSCHACERCEGCAECTFCVGSARLSRSHFCTDCEDCTDCAHCVRSKGCLSSQHCIDSERCVGSAYLVRSVGCLGCTYCFGCVGLARRDFHILNEPYDRAAYFALASRLARELRITLP